MTTLLPLLLTPHQTARLNALLDVAYPQTTWDILQEMREFLQPIVKEQTTVQAKWAAYAKGEFATQEGMRDILQSIDGIQDEVPPLKIQGGELYQAVWLRVETKLL